MMTFDIIKTNLWTAHNTFQGSLSVCTFTFVRVSVLAKEHQWTTGIYIEKHKKRKVLSTGDLSGWWTLVLAPHPQKKENKFTAFPSKEVHNCLLYLKYHLFRDIHVINSLHLYM